MRPWLPVSRIPRALGYGFAAGTQAATSFLVLPLTILLIGPTAYGRFSLLEPLVAMLAQVLLLGAHQGLIHAISKEDASPISTLRSALWQSQAYMLPLTAAIAAAVTLWQRRLDLGLIFAGALYIEALNLLCLSAIRAVGDAWAYLIGVVAKAAVLLIGTLLALTLVGRDQLDERYPLCLIGGGTLVSLGLLSLRIFVRQQATPAANASVAPTHVWAFVRYGFPLVLAGLCQSVVMVADRFFLSAFVSPAGLSAYVVASKLANAMNLAAAPFNLWWPTARFQHMRDADRGQSFFRITAVKVGGIYGALALVLIGSAPWTLPVLGPGVRAVPGIAALLIAATFLQALQVVLNIGTLAAGHTQKLFYVTASASALHILGCYLLIPRWGTYGAATMGVVTAALIALSVNAVSQRIVVVAHNRTILALQVVIVASASLAMAMLGATP